MEEEAEKERHSQDPRPPSLAPSELQPFFLLRTEDSNLLVYQ